LYYRKRRESKGGKNRDKRIMMVKLIIQKKPTKINTTKCNPCIDIQVRSLIWSH
jgi:hypothetical protein